MNPWLIIVAILAVGGAYSYGKYEGVSEGLHQGRVEVQQKWDAERQELKDEHIKALEKAAKVQSDLQVNVDKIRQEKDREIREISARATALSNSVRNRPDRPTEAGSVPGAARSCSGASGAELARGDGEFLVGYSADAAKLEKALDKCVGQYQAVKDSATESNRKPD